jgi:hypothetical protein
LACRYACAAKVQIGSSILKTASIVLMQILSTNS